MKLETLENLFVHEIKDLTQCRKAARQSITENGKGRVERLRCERPLRNIWNKPRRTSSDWNGSSRWSMLLRGLNTAKQWKV